MLRSILFGENLAQSKVNFFARFRFGATRGIFDKFLRNRNEAILKWFLNLLEG